MEKIKSIVQIYFTVAGCMVVAVAVFATILNPVETLDPMILWQIPAVSLLCGIGWLIFPATLRIGCLKKRPLLRTALHFLYINGAVLIPGRIFGWYGTGNAGSVFSMAAAVAIIYGLISGIFWRRAAMEAKRMNERLQQHQQEQRR